MTRDDVIGYLEDMKASKRWKRTYSLFSIIVTRFFNLSDKDNPNISYKERSKPEVVVNLGKVRFDKKTYKPQDMWTLEDNEVIFY
jgi:hypothetical protein